MPPAPRDHTSPLQRSSGHHCNRVLKLTTAPQIEALEAAGCQRVYEERVSGGRWDRPELHRLLDRLGPGDVLTVWKLDRLSRSLKDLLLILDRVEKAGAGFRSLTENIDSTTASGRMMMQMLGAFAEFERAMVRERTQAGLRSARAQRRHGGRQPKLSPQQGSPVAAEPKVRLSPCRRRRAPGCAPALVARTDPRSTSDEPGEPALTRDGGFPAQRHG